MKKIVSLALAVIMLMSVMVIGTNAAGFAKYNPSSREATVLFDNDPLVRDAATLSVNDYYYSDAACLRVRNALTYSSYVAIYNMVIYTTYDVIFTTGAIASDGFYEVASEQNYVSTRNIPIYLNGRTISNIVVTHIANSDDLNNTGHLDAFTTAVVTATYR